MMKRKAGSAHMLAASATAIDLPFIQWSVLSFSLQEQLDWGPGAMDQMMAAFMWFDHELG